MVLWNPGSRGCLTRAERCPHGVWLGINSKTPPVRKTCKIEYTGNQIHLTECFALTLRQCPLKRTLAYGQPSDQQVLQRPAPPVS